MLKLEGWEVLEASCILPQTLRAAILDIDRRLSNQTYTDSLCSRLYGHPVRIILRESAAEEYRILADIKRHAALEHKGRGEKFATSKVNRATTTRAGVDCFLNCGCVEGDTIAHGAIFSHVVKRLRRWHDGGRNFHEVEGGMIGIDDA